MSNSLKNAHKKNIKEKKNLESLKKELAEEIENERIALKEQQDQKLEEIEKIRQCLEAEKKAWQDEVLQMKDHLPGKTLHLNVRGSYFLLSKRLLTSIPGSALGAFFSGRHPVETVDEKIFVDRDP